MSKLSFSNIDAAEAVDIAIVGAGISGLYCAYRLLAAYPDKKIAIFERLNRTGGRLQTDLVSIPQDYAPFPSNGDGKTAQPAPVPPIYTVVKDEEGGMRVNYAMTELMALNKQLDLCDQLVPFPMGTGDGTAESPNTNRYFVRGRGFSVVEANASGNMIWSELYDLDEREIGQSPGEIVTDAYNRILQANHWLMSEFQSPEFWQYFRLNAKWDGVPMNQWTMWGLLRKMGYSQECIEMLTDTIGFAGPFLSLANAGDAWQILADFPLDPQYYTYQDGYSTLPDAVVAQLGDQVPIYLGTNVSSISGSADNFELLLSEAPEGQTAKPGTPGMVFKTVMAKQIISAVAIEGAKKLFLGSPALHRPSKSNNAVLLWDSLNTVLGMDLMKINLFFSEAWWLNGSSSRPLVQFGPNFTDMPINSIYPFYAPDNLEVDQKAGTVKVKDATLPAALTLYCDFNNTNFWKGLQNVGPKFDSPTQTMHNQMVPQTIFAASVAVVSEMRTQLAELFGVTNVPVPLMTSFRNWNGEDAFEFAYHQWQLNANDKDVIAYLANPLPGVYMCNEAISDMQGWVNGSLRSCDLALGKISGGVIQPLDPTQVCISPMSSANSKAAPSHALKGKRMHRGLWGG